MSESALHYQCWKVVTAYGRNDVLAFHVPNGEARSRRVGSKLQAMGVRPGAPDFIFIKGGVVHGVELKTTKGRLSPHQIQFQCDLERAGGHYHIARSLDEFIKILNAIGAFRVRMAAKALAGIGARTPDVSASGEPFTERTGEPT